MRRPQHQQTQSDYLLRGGITLTAFLLYLFTLAPTVLEADAGEFQFVAWLPGIAHPTGYPLYTLLGWLWTHLFPLGEVAWRMNLLSAVLAALAVGGLFSLSQAIIGQLTENRLHQQLSSLLVAGLFAVSLTFWSQAIMAEVYALHLLLVVLILATMLERQSSLRLAIIFGLGLAHHSTTVLLIPAVVIWRFGDLTQDKAVATQTRSIVPSFHRSIVQLLILVGIPLMFYLYLPLIAPYTPYSSLELSPTQSLVLYEQSWQGWLNHITGQVFASDLQPTAVGNERFALAMEFAVQEVGWPGIILGVLGAFILLMRPTTRALGLMLVVTFVAIVGFNLSYFIGDVYVLFIPAWLLLTVWIGVGALTISHWLAQTIASRFRSVNQTLYQRPFEQKLHGRARDLLTSSLLLMTLAWPIWHASHNGPLVDQSDNRQAAQRWQEILAEPIPEQAVLISNDRNEIMPMWYYQFVEHQRPDLLGLFPLIVPDYRTVGTVLDEALLSNRPVYLIKPMPGLGLKAQLTPVGSLVQATPYTTSPQTVTNLHFNNEAESIRLVGYDVVQEDGLELTLFWQVEQRLQYDYTTFAHLLNQTGEGITQSDQPPGGVFYPPSQWTEGELLRDHHQLTLPPSLAQGEYRLRVGLYVQPEPGQFVNLGTAQELGAITYAP